MKLFKPLDTGIPDDSYELDYDKLVNFSSTHSNFRGLRDYEILRIFIAGIFRSAVPKSMGPLNQPTNLGSYQMYKHVFSKMVVPDDPADPEIPVSYVYPAPTTGGFTNTTRTSNDRLVFPKLDKYDFMSGSNDEELIGFVNDTEFCELNHLIPSPVHQGLLLDGCHVMAMMKIRYYLKRDGILLLKRSTVYNRITQGTAKARLTPVTVNLLNFLLNNEGFGTIHLDQYNKDTDGLGEARTAILKFLNPDNIYGFDTDIVADNINVLWKFNNRRNIKTDVLLNVLNGLSAVYEEMIKGFTLAMYRKLGGVHEKVDTKSLFIGDGSTTAGLLDKQLHGVSLFSYSYEIVGNRVRPKPLVKYSIELPELTPSENNVVHIDLFGIDPKDSPALYIRATRFLSGESEPTPIESYLALSRISMLTGFMRSDSLSNIWVDDDGKQIGYYIMETNEIVITDDSIYSLEFVFGETGKVNLDTFEYRETAGTIAELCLTLSSFKQKKPQSVSLELAAITLFDNDRFEVSNDSKKELFWPLSDGPGRQNVSNLIDLIKAGYTVKAELKGNSVGRFVIPAQYDISGNYFVNEYVMKDNLLKQFDGSVFNVPVIQASTTYSYSDLVPAFIMDGANEKIYRLIADDTTSASPIISSSWEEVASVYKENTSYSDGDRVVRGNLLFEAVGNINSSDNPRFISQQWRNLSRIEQDPRYQPFSGNPTGADAPDKPFLAQATTSPGTGNLTSKIYSQLRYSFVRADIDSVNQKITFIIDSFASPLVSRLDKRLLGPNLDGSTADSNTDYNFASNATRKTNLDGHTLFGLNGDAQTDMEIAAENAPYYNQVLTAFRSFGVLETVVCRIKLISGNDSDVVSALDALLIDDDTFVETAENYNGSGGSTNTFKKVWYNASTTSSPAQENQYEYYKWYVSLTEETNEYGSTCDD